MEEFGKRKLAKVDIYPSGELFVDNKPFRKDELSKKVQCIHGHFTWDDLHERFSLGEDVHYVTWLRDPVKRVISNYFFLKKIIAERLRETPTENLMARMGKSLEEFVVQEETRDVMSKFVGEHFDKFSCIGLQDYFEEDLKRMTQKMGWKPLQNIEHNVTGKQNQSVVTPDQIELIKSMNSRDVELYNHALDLRNSVSNRQYS